MAGGGVVVDIGEGVVVEARNSISIRNSIKSVALMEIITRSQICGNTCRAADNRQEPTFSCPDI